METFKCEHCGREFKTKAGLASHIRMKHKDPVEAVEKPVEESNGSIPEDDKRLLELIKMPRSSKVNEEIYEIYRRKYNKVLCIACMNQLGYLMRWSYEYLRVNYGYER